MARRTRNSLRARAQRHASMWGTPTHQLRPLEAEARVRNAWLWGYEAAQRDAARDRRAAGVEREERRRFFNHGAECRCVMCS